MATKKTAGKPATKKQLPPLPEVASNYPSFYGSVAPPRSQEHRFITDAFDLHMRITNENARSKGLDEAADTMTDWAVSHFKSKDDRAAYALRECAAHIENVAQDIYRARVSPYEGNARQIIETALLMLTAEQLAQLREKFLAVS